MSKVEDLVDLVDLCRKKCPWCKIQDMDSYSKQLLSEAKELRLAVKNNDMKNIEEEIGDILWDSFMFIKLSGLSTSKIIDKVNKKMLRRKPFLKSKQTVTLEEAKHLWKKAKLREKRTR